MMDPNADTKTSAMIALLPMTSEWCKIDLPHLTLVYAGEIADAKTGAFNELAKDAASIAMLSSTITTKVTGAQVFGGNGDPQVDVLTLRPSPELLAMRRQVERWNKSTYPFAPHVTVGPSTGMPPQLFDMPSYIAFDRIMVGWGADQLIFWLRR